MSIIDNLQGDEPMPQPSQISVNLISAPEYPLATLWAVWDQSKHNHASLPHPYDINRLLYMADEDLEALPPYMVLFLRDRYAAHGDRESLRLFKQDFYATVRRLIQEKVPTAEMLNFVFQINGVPVALREQMVRHRVGAKQDERIGFDIVPNLTDSSFWAQSHRVLDMGQFYDLGDWYLPPSLEGKTVRINLDSTLPPVQGRAETAYRAALVHAQQTYAALVEAGVPEEDARNVLPFGVTHRMAWSLNLATVMHVIGKRSCWIMQGGLWQPIIDGVIEALAAVDPIFRDLATPPCLKGDSFVGCPFIQSNLDRISAKDPNPPCALYLRYHTDVSLSSSVAQDNPDGWFYDNGRWKTNNAQSLEQYRDKCDYHEKLWGRNPVTGKRG